MSDNIPYWKQQEIQADKDCQERYNNSIHDSEKTTIESVYGVLREGVGYEMDLE